MFKKYSTVRSSKFKNPQFHNLCILYYEIANHPICGLHSSPTRSSRIKGKPQGIGFALLIHKGFMRKCRCCLPIEHHLFKSPTVLLLQQFYNLTASDVTYENNYSQLQGSKHHQTHNNHSSRKTVLLYVQHQLL